jgi:Tfp pilus assembly protein PilX
MKVASRWNLQHNKDNKGASLVTVLLTVSIVSAITMLVLAIAVLNMYMKKADLRGQSAFYDAESALEEIRTGLSYEASSAASYAYIDTLSNYSDTTDEEKVDNFQKLYRQKLKEAVVGDTINSWYKAEVLESYLRDTKYDEETGVGAKVSYPENGNYVNVEAGVGVVLKNVIVT